MNVNSSTVATSQNTQQASTATKSAENSAVSFEEEMKSVQEQDVVAEENSSQLQEDEVDSKEQNAEYSSSKEKHTLLSGKAEFTGELIDNQITSKDLLSLNIKQLLETQNQISLKGQIFNVSISTEEDLTKNIGQNLEMSLLDMNEADAMFFVDLVKNNNVGVQAVVQDLQQALEFGSEEVQKTANVSKTLINALQNSMKTGQAVRIDFGNDVAVVMRVGRDGSIMANFIPGDKAVEEYLKNNIGFLKQRFEDEDIKYSQLSYSNHQQQERRQNNKNKENKHE